MERKAIKIRITIMFVLLLFNIGVIIAQPDDGGPGQRTPFGFVEVLIGAGALYGGKKVHDAKKNKK
tara:strand:+ start:465 stop:662 length:198 start_codon:yes stop_codon:yes gene_type:complete